MTDEYNIKERSVNGFVWSFINTGGTQVVGFVFGIFLARILNPADFGNVAIVMFFASMANVFVDSGFGHALIKDQNANNKDYNTVFIFSLTISILCGLGLYFISSSLSSYYELPILESLTKIVSISPVIHALMVVQSTLIVKQLDFKLKASLSLTSIIISGVLSVIMALNGLGVWSLLIMYMLSPALLMLLLWMKIPWKPSFTFSLNSIIKYADFGMKLTLSNVVNVFYKSVPVLIIGKTSNVEVVGQYSRADNLKNIPSQTLDKIIQRVTYPFLATLQGDDTKQKMYYEDVVRYSALIIIPAMLGLSSISEPFVLTLLGEKWLPASEYLLLLCFVALFYPFHSLSMNIIKVAGSMNVFIIIDLIKIILMIPVLYLGSGMGVKGLIALMIVHSFFVFLVSTVYAGKCIGYNVKSYFLDIKNSLYISLVMFLSIQLFVEVVDLPAVIELFSSVFIGICIFIAGHEICHTEEYTQIKNRVLQLI